MNPLNPSLARDVADSFRRQPIMKLIGARLSLVEPGVVEITLPYRTDLAQQNGLVLLLSLVTRASAISKPRYSSPTTDVLNGRTATEFPICAGGGMVAD